MKCLRLPSLFAALLTLVATLAAAPVQALGGLPDFTALVRENGPAVVNISTTAPQEEATADNGRDVPQLEMPNLPEDHPLNDLFRRFFGDLFDVHSAG